VDPAQQLDQTVVDFQVGQFVLIQESGDRTGSSAHFRRDNGTGHASPVDERLDICNEGGGVES
jgi:hypothetical protein